MLLIEYFRART